MLLVAVLPKLGFHWRIGLGSLRIMRTIRRDGYVFRGLSLAVGEVGKGRRADGLRPFPLASDELYSSLPSLFLFVTYLEFAHSLRVTRIEFVYRVCEARERHLMAVSVADQN